MPGVAGIYLTPALCRERGLLKEPLAFALVGRAGLSPTPPWLWASLTLLGAQAPRCHCGEQEARRRPGPGCAGRAGASLTLSSLLQVILTSPTEVAKVRLQTQSQMQTQAQTQCWRSSASWPAAVPTQCPALPVTLGAGPKYRGPLHCLATVTREEGLRGLYKGSSALLLRDSHSFATYFLSYSILCEWFAPTGQSQPGEDGVGLGIGAAQPAGTGAGRRSRG